MDAYDFIFRIEKQARIHGISAQTLLIGIGDLLEGRAAQWFWTFQQQRINATWDQLKTAFMRRYAAHRDSDFEIRAKIEARKQRHGESFNDFCQDVEALEVRLTHRMQENVMVEVLKRNMSMPLQKALWRDRITSVDDLLDICNDYERICEEENLQASRQRNRISELSQLQTDQSLYAQNTDFLSGESHVVDALQSGMTRNDLTICWNCKEIGHPFTLCKSPRQHLFCFSCGMSGVVKASCHKCSGNSRKDVAMAAAGRPSIEMQPQRQLQ